MQSKVESFVESVVNLFWGYVTALISQLFIFPWFDIHITFAQNMLMCLIFTVISLIRVYVIRRWFNKKVINRQPNELAYPRIELWVANMHERYTKLFL